MRKFGSKSKKDTPTTTIEHNISKPKLLVTIVDRSKALFYTDLLEQFEVNLQLTMLGHGTASSETLSLLGLDNSEKAIILSVVKEENVKDIMDTLTEKFHKIKNGNGIAYTISFNSIIGVSMYKFLINDQS